MLHLVSHACSFAAQSLSNSSRLLHIDVRNGGTEKIPRHARNLPEAVTDAGFVSHALQNSSWPAVSTRLKGMGMADRPKSFEHHKAATIKFVVNCETRFWLKSPRFEIILVGHHPFIPASALGHAVPVQPSPWPFSESPYDSTYPTTHP